MTRDTRRVTTTTRRTQSALRQLNDTIRDYAHLADRHANDWTGNLKAGGNPRTSGGDHPDPTGNTATTRAHDATTDTPADYANELDAAHKAFQTHAKLLHHVILKGAVQAQKEPVVEIPCANPPCNEFILMLESDSIIQRHHYCDLCTRYSHNHNGHLPTADTIYRREQKRAQRDQPPAPKKRHPR